MAIERWWRRTRRAQLKQATPPTSDELRRRAAEEDAACALFGPECERVEAGFDDRRRTHVLTVTYRDGRVLNWHPHTA